jgi:hypothetical protein
VKNLSERDPAAARVVSWLEGRAPAPSIADLARYVLLRTGDADPLDLPASHAYFDRAARRLAEEYRADVEMRTKAVPRTNFGRSRDRMPRFEVDHWDDGDGYMVTDRRYTKDGSYVDSEPALEVAAGLDEAVDLMWDAVEGRWEHVRNDVIRFLAKQGR